MVKVTRLVLEAIDDGETKLDEMRKVEKMIQKLFASFHTQYCVSMLQSYKVILLSLSFHFKTFFRTLSELQLWFI